MTRDEREKVMKWVRNAPGDLAEIWQSSECAGQLLRLAIYAGVDRRSVSLALCDCVRIVLPFANSDTPRRTIEIIEKWSRGAATSEQVLAAADAAEAVAEAAVNAAAEAAAAVADAAADAAYAAAGAAYEVSAVYTVAYVVVAAVTSAALNRAEMERRCADTIRARIPWATVEAALIRARKEDRPR